MNLARLKGYSFELGPIRPPSEGNDHSLLLRATRNCPWNRCQFCNVYKGKRFGYRSVEEVKQDIDIVRALADEIKATSWRLGYGGRVNDEVVRAIVRGNPEIYGTDFADSEVLRARLGSLVNVAGWLSSGARTVFLQDADTLIMRTPELVEVTQYLKEAFPSTQRVTSYARAKTCAQRSVDELKELQQAGLSRLHVGLESGYDEVLQEMQKGVTQQEHIEGGRKVVQSGISLSEYVMPGLGGKRWSQRHALETAKALSQINPDYIRIRSLVVRRGSPLYDKLKQGEFHQLTEDEVIDEIGLLIENLDCNSYLVSDQMSNLLWEIEGKLPQDKPSLLKRIAEYKAMLPSERLLFTLKRRLGSYVAVYGRLDQGLNQKVEEAFEGIQKGLPEAEAKVDEAISALKDGFV